MLTILQTRIALQWSAAQNVTGKTDSPELLFVSVIVSTKTHII